MTRAGIWSLILSDYDAHYAYKDEGRGRRRALLLPRLMTNASMHAIMLVRLSCGTPHWMAWIWRRLLLSSHSIDWARETTIGTGLQLPHPFGLAVGRGTVLGNNVRLFHNVTVGPWVPARPGWMADRDGQAPQPSARLVVGDGVDIFPGAVVLGATRIGAGAMVGANQLVLEDVPAGGRATRGRVTAPRT